MSVFMMKRIFFLLSILVFTCPLVLSAKVKNVRLSDLDGNVLENRVELHGEEIHLFLTNRSFIIDCSQHPGIMGLPRIDVFQNGRICFSGKIPESGKMICIYGVLNMDHSKYMKKEVEPLFTVKKETEENVFVSSPSQPAEVESPVILASEPVSETIRTNYIPMISVKSQNSEKIEAEVIELPRILVVETSSNDMIQIPDVLFKFNRHDLTLEAKQTLDQLEPYFLKESTEIIVRGFTDNLGKPSYNLGLSRKRADSVSAYLQEKFRISANKISSVGMGEKEPINDNSTPSGREKNRRVTIEVRK